MMWYISSKNFLSKDWQLRIGSFSEPVAFKKKNAQLDLRYATWNFPTQSHEKGDYFHTMDLFGNVTFLEKKSGIMQEGPLNLTVS